MLQPLHSPWDQRPGLSGLLEDRLGEIAPSRPGDRVEAAIRHSLLDGGKRLRPKILVLAAESFGGSVEVALDPACAVEMVHTASLIFDDLPCMDDSSLRRGRPSCHTAYGVDIATLAGVSLLTRSFAVLASAPDLASAQRTALVGTLSDAVGDVGGMVAGQVRDLESAVDSTGLADVRTLASQKTAGLFVCAARMGALTAGADEVSVSAVGEFAHRFGMCFQVLDDLADLESSPQRLGKDVRKDVDKVTFATLLGPIEGRRLARRLARESLSALETVDLDDSALATTAREAFSHSRHDLLGQR